VGSSAMGFAGDKARGDDAADALRYLVATKSRLCSCLSPKDAASGSE